MEDEDAPVMGTVPRQKVTARCKSIDRYGDSDVDLTRKRSFSDEYFKRVARDLKSIPCLLLLGNIFAFVFLIIWSNIAKHIFVSQTPSTATAPLETTPPLIRSIRELHMCNQPRCGAIGHAISYAVSPDYLPCQDVMKHVCGDWIKSDAETYEKMILGSARLYVEDMYTDIKRYLESVPLTQQLNAQQKVSMFYRKCLYEYRSLNNKEAMLQRIFFDTYGLRGWPYETFSGSMVTLLAKFLHRTSEGALLSVGTARYLSTGRVTATVTDNCTDKVSLSLDCPTFPLPVYNILRQDSAFEQSYLNFIKKAINTVGVFKSRKVPEALVKNIVVTEQRIALASRKYCHRRQLKPREMSYFNQTLKISLVEFLREVVGDKDGQVVKDNTCILSRSDNYLRYIATFFRDTKKLVRAVNYVGWRIIHFYGKHAFPSITDEELLKIIPPGAYNRSMEPDWKRCLKITSDALPIGLGRVYVEAMLRLKTLFAVQELVNKVVFSFKHLLSQTVWMDKPVRERAYELLASLKTMVGIPKWVADDKILDSYYSNYGNNVSHSFFELFVEATQHTATSRFFTLFASKGRGQKRVPGNEKEVNVRPLHSFIFPSRVVDLELRRYNMRQGLIFDVIENSILLPAGVLQPPYYDPNLPLAVNYGGLGMLILHDMVSEFFRFHFDASEEKWRDRKKCINDNVFRKQDDSSGGLEESKEHVVVIFTMMTIRAAYNAYHYALGKDDDDIVSGLGADSNPDQLFMLTAVRTMCSILRDRHYVIARQPEGASLIRKVSSALQGMDELVDAFRCPASDKKTSYYRCMESERVHTSEGGN
ncbi:endothelin-converting enzyme 1-like [Haemaphysalis longicornis]